MALPAARDLDEARHDLQGWLAAHLPGATDVRLSEITGSAASGFSNETLIFDASWSAGGQEHQQGFVVRVRPTTHTVFPTDRWHEQVALLRALGPTDVKVPVLRWEEPDHSVLGSDFLVMERVDGEVPSDNPPYASEGWLRESTPDQQASVWWSGLEAMAAVHRVDVASLGDLPAGLDPGEGAPGGRLAARLQEWADYLAWAAEDRPQPAPEAALAWLRDNLPTEEGPPALCWGDSRIGNQIFRDHRVAAVLDWEMAHIGDPMADLAWFLYMDRFLTEAAGQPRLPGFGTSEESVARWEALTGRTARDLTWHLVQAGLGFASVMVRLSRLLVHSELFPADSDFDVTNPGATALADLMAEVAT